MLFMKFRIKLSLLKWNDSFFKATIKLEFRITIGIALVVLGIYYEIIALKKISLILLSSLSSDGHRNGYIGLSS